MSSSWFLTGVSEKNCHRGRNWGKRGVVCTTSESHEIKKNSVVTGIEPTTSGLLDQRRSRSDNQAPAAVSTLMVRL